MSTAAVVRGERCARQLDVAVTIDAALATVWAAMVEVERWPEWTASVTHMQRRSTQHGGTGMKEIAVARFPNELEGRLGVQRLKASQNRELADCGDAL